MFEIGPGDTVEKGTGQESLNLLLLGRVQSLSALILSGILKFWITEGTGFPWTVQENYNSF